MKIWAWECIPSFFICISHFSFLISHLKQTVMSKNKVNAKREAYAKKQEEQGRKVVAWIFGALIVLAIIYMIWTFTMVA